ncbi:helix-turn-helix domain-containing protein [Burkholderia multivorans]|uniref:Helix-turn-helix domain-containing protein n=1 Tax=Burkholderia multivorans TaxID=87883 RepID=A0AB37AN68_9BURK|nr:helix-turn-helix domain-containing protein [Burkholderia multivorans]PRE43859.1 helix-turn-helix domain-containing protein [Burkholderia multivorans]PRE54662.1 helix-turn-helix domain-containing protein [Burkholderia multivorans]
MSIKAMNWAWEQRLPPNSKLILMALADAADEVGQCWPRVRLIAEKCCTSERTVQRILKELETAGFLHIERNYRKDGSQSSNVYSLSLAPPPDKLSPPSDRLAPGGDTGVRPPVTGMTPPGDRATSPHEPPTRTISKSSLQLPAKIIHTPSPSHAPDEGEKGACGALVWPSRLNERERCAIALMVNRLDVNDAQMLLDELAGVLATQSIKTSPERWFRAVLDRFHQGRFTPSAGLAAKESRLHVQRTPVETPRTASPEVTRHYLERIQAMLSRKEATVE